MIANVSRVMGIYAIVRVASIATYLAAFGAEWSDFAARVIMGFFVVVLLSLYVLLSYWLLKPQQTSQQNLLSAAFIPALLFAVFVSSFVFDVSVGVDFALDPFYTSSGVDVLVAFLLGTTFVTGVSLAAFGAVDEGMKYSTQLVYMISFAVIITQWLLMFLGLQLKMIRQKGQS